MRVDLCTNRRTTNLVLPVRAHITLVSDPLAVRTGLLCLLGMAPLCDLSDDLRGTIELVLAEALNNIVEHAYAQYNGQIGITLILERSILQCEVVDQGMPMPLNLLPPGQLADRTSLPEGGYGWFLIRSLTCGLAYDRRDDTNTLVFQIDVG